MTAIEGRSLAAGHPRVNSTAGRAWSGCRAGSRPVISLPNQRLSARFASFPGTPRVAMSRMPPHLLQDGILGLRAPEPSDADAYLAFRNDLGAAGDLIGFVRGVPAHKVREWIAGIEN